VGEGQRNTLAEVVFQARFGRVLKIDAELPIALQEALQASHPILEVEEGLQINLAAGQASTATPTKTYKFFTDDKSEFLSLNSSFFGVNTTNYTDWQKFSSSIALMVGAASGIYGIKSFSRFGLRYINILDRVKLELKDCAWNDLLQPHALAWIADPSCEAWATVGQAEAVYEDGVISCRVRSGLLPRDVPSNLSFLLDADYFMQGILTGDVTGIMECANELNSYSGPFFRWCITDRLHTLLDPKSS
jgi:uncharacterized protein (TIGR04255 family)